ncbi:hypothetical protein B9Z55_009032 [Caenorhabditis nigoni]|uniref:Uncharacterized protein n=1 Tax=Caenorhabditis nigoni TaxID=1611254 RepID=A0A2G5UQ95_9PELO|nr:hypothetical protein B9Z55_009032 [Caenorhabditis nigoni]
MCEKIHKIQSAEKAQSVAAKKRIMYSQVAVPDKFSRNIPPLSTMDLCDEIHSPHQSRCVVPKKRGHPLASLVRDVKRRRHQILNGINPIDMGAYDKHFEALEHKRLAENVSENVPSTISSTNSTEDVPEFFCHFDRFHESRKMIFYALHEINENVSEQEQLENWYRQMLTDAKSVKSFGYNLKIDKLASFKAISTSFKRHSPILKQEQLENRHRQMLTDAKSVKSFSYNLKIDKLLEIDWDTDGITLDEEKAKRHALMYIELNSNRLVTRINRKTDEEWMKFLVDRKLFFNNKVRAQHATLETIVAAQTDGRDRHRL